MRLDFRRVQDEVYATVLPTITDAVRTAAPGKGDYTNRIQGRRQDDRLEITGEQPWGWVVHGTRAHPIEAQNRALRFEWRGSVVFFRRVFHPGTRANDFPARGWNAVKENVRNQFADAVQRGFDRSVPDLPRIDL